MVLLYMFLRLTLMAISWDVSKCEHHMDIVYVSTESLEQCRYVKDMATKMYNSLKYMIAEGTVTVI